MGKKIKLDKLKIKLMIKNNLLQLFDFASQYGCIKNIEEKLIIAVKKIDYTIN